MVLSEELNRRAIIVIITDVKRIKFPVYWTDNTSYRYNKPIGGTQITSRKKRRKIKREKSVHSEGIERIGSGQPIEQPSLDRITTRITANNNPGRIGRLDNEAECVRALTYVREGEA